MAQEIYKNKSLNLQISVSDGFRRQVVQSSGGDTRVVVSKPTGDLRNVLNARRSRAGSSVEDATPRSETGCYVGQTGDLRQCLNEMRAQSMSQSTNIRFQRIAAVFYQLRRQLGGVVMGNGSSILSYLSSLVPAHTLSRAIMVPMASARLTEGASNDYPVLAHRRFGRKRHSSSLSDEGAPEVADEPPAKRARLKLRLTVAARFRGIQIDAFHWQANPYVWQREDYICEQKKSSTWGRDHYAWQREECQTPVRPAACYTWKRPAP
ncbi:uncharacterized protein LOC127837465 [Dreissena polymorpha]|uniref:uncharacterized protein LOC127837465 n=1 Tax=Dreissena polymorpha TaxID=45954 RepID=UPI002263BE19|nr:uncharacterized protein LOC127837465 [Dreissena polymorpha]